MAEEDTQKIPIIIHVNFRLASRMAMSAEALACNYIASKCAGSSYAKGDPRLTMIGCVEGTEYSHCHAEGITEMEKDIIYRFSLVNLEEKSAPVLACWYSFRDILVIVTPLYHLDTKSILTHPLFTTIEVPVTGPYIGMLDLNLKFEGTQAEYTVSTEGETPMKEMKETVGDRISRIATLLMQRHNAVCKAVYGADENQESFGTLLPQFMGAFSETPSMSKLTPDRVSLSVSKQCTGGGNYSQLLLSDVTSTDPETKMKYLRLGMAVGGYALKNPGVVGLERIDHLIYGPAPRDPIRNAFYITVEVITIPKSANAEFERVYLKKGSSPRTEISKEEFPELDKGHILRMGSMAYELADECLRIDKTLTREAVFEAASREGAKVDLSVMDFKRLYYQMFGEYADDNYAQLSGVLVGTNDLLSVETMEIMEDEDNVVADMRIGGFTDIHGYHFMFWMPELVWREHCLDGHGSFLYKEAAFDTLDIGMYKGTLEDAEEAVRRSTHKFLRDPLMPTKILPPHNSTQKGVAEHLRKIWGSFEGTESSPSMGPVFGYPYMTNPPRFPATSQNFVGSQEVRFIRDLKSGTLHAGNVRRTHLTPEKIKDSVLQVLTIVNESRIDGSEPPKTFKAKEAKKTGCKGSCPTSQACRRCDLWKILTIRVQKNGEGLDEKSPLKGATRGTYPKGIFDAIGPLLELAGVGAEADLKKLLTPEEKAVAVSEAKKFVASNPQLDLERGRVTQRFVERAALRKSREVTKTYMRPVRPDPVVMEEMKKIITRSTERDPEPIGQALLSRRSAPKPSPGKGGTSTHFDTTMSDATSVMKALDNTVFIRQLEVFSRMQASLAAVTQRHSSNLSVIHSSSLNQLAICMPGPRQQRPYLELIRADPGSARELMEVWGTKVPFWVELDGYEVIACGPFRTQTADQSKKAELHHRVRSLHLQLCHLKVEPSESVEYLTRMTYQAICGSSAIMADIEQAVLMMGGIGGDVKKNLEGVVETGSRRQIDHIFIGELISFVEQRTVDAETFERLTGDSSETEVTEGVTVNLKASFFGLQIRDSRLARMLGACSKHFGSPYGVPIGQKGIEKPVNKLIQMGKDYLTELGNPDVDKGSPTGVRVEDYTETSYQLLMNDNLKKMKRSAPHTAYAAGYRLVQALGYDKGEKLEVLIAKALREPLTSISNAKSLQAGICDPDKCSYSRFMTDVESDSPFLQGTTTKSSAIVGLNLASGFSQRLHHAASTSSPVKNATRCTETTQVLSLKMEESKHERRSFSVNNSVVVSRLRIVEYVASRLNKMLVEDQIDKPFTETASIMASMMKNAQRAAKDSLKLIEEMAEGERDRIVGVFEEMENEFGLGWFLDGGIERALAYNGDCSKYSEGSSALRLASLMSGVCDAGNVDKYAKRILVHIILSTSVYRFFMPQMILKHLEGPLSSEPGSKSSDLAKYLRLPREIIEKCFYSGGTGKFAVMATGQGQGYFNKLWTFENIASLRYCLTVARPEVESFLIDRGVCPTTAESTVGRVNISFANHSDDFTVVGGGDPYVAPLMVGLLVRMAYQGTGWMDSRTKKSFVSYLTYLVGMESSGADTDPSVSKLVASALRVGKGPSTDICHTVGNLQASSGLKLALSAVASEEVLSQWGVVTVENNMRVSPVLRVLLDGLKITESWHMGLLPFLPTAFGVLLATPGYLKVGSDIHNRNAIVRLLEQYSSSSKTGVFKKYPKLPAVLLAVHASFFSENGLFLEDDGDRQGVSMVTPPSTQALRDGKTSNTSVNAIPYLLQHLPDGLRLLNASRFAKSRRDVFHMIRSLKQSRRMKLSNFVAKAMSRRFKTSDGTKPFIDCVKMVKEWVDNNVSASGDLSEKAMDQVTRLLLLSENPLRDASVFDGLYVSSDRVSDSSSIAPMYRKTNLTHSRTPANLEAAVALIIQPDLFFPGVSAAVYTPPVRQILSTLKVVPTVSNFNLVVFLIESLARQRITICAPSNTGNPEAILEVSSALIGPNRLVRTSGRGSDRVPQFIQEGVMEVACSLMHVVNLFYDCSEETTAGQMARASTALVKSLPSEIDGTAVETIFQTLTASDAKFMTREWDPAYASALLHLACQYKTVRTQNEELLRRIAKHAGTRRWELEKFNIGDYSFGLTAVSWGSAQMVRVTYLEIGGLGDLKHFYLMYTPGGTVPIRRVVQMQKEINKISMYGDIGSGYLQGSLPPDAVMEILTKDFPQKSYYTDGTRYEIGPSDVTPGVSPRRSLVFKLLSPAKQETFVFDTAARGAPVYSTSDRVYVVHGITCYISPFHNMETVPSKKMLRELWEDFCDSQECMEVAISSGIFSLRHLPSLEVYTSGTPFSPPRPVSMGRCLELALIEPKVRDITGDGPDLSALEGTIGALSLMMMKFSFAQVDELRSAKFIRGKRLAAVLTVHHILYSSGAGSFSQSDVDVLHGDPVSAQHILRLANSSDDPAALALAFLWAGDWRVPYDLVDTRSVGHMRIPNGFLGRAGSGLQKIAERNYELTSYPIPFSPDSWPGEDPALDDITIVVDSGKMFGIADRLPDGDRFTAGGIDWVQTDSLEGLCVMRAKRSEVWVSYYPFLLMAETFFLRKGVLRAIRSEKISCGPSFIRATPNKVMPSLVLLPNAFSVLSRKDIESAYDLGDDDVFAHMMLQSAGKGGK